MSHPPARRLTPWFIWLALFYLTWLTLVITGSHWHTLREK